MFEYMALFKKQKIEFEEETNKTPVQFNKHGKELDPNRRKKIKRWAIISVVALLLGVGGYFGIRAYSSIINIFANETGLLNLLGGSQEKLLKGEIDGRVNILLLGVGDEGHSGSTLSDTMIVTSYNTSPKAVSMISIPRDTYVKIPSNDYTKINSAHAYGEQKEEGLGPEWAIKTVEDYSGLPIHYYVRVDFSGLEKIVDALGGVTVNVENSFCDYNYPKRGPRKPVCFDKGEQYMDGKEALMYSRSRKALGTEGSDFARAKRQQNLLVAIKNKALSSETVFNPAKVLSVLDALGKHIKTNFKTTDISRLYDISKEVDNSMIIKKNLDTSTNLLKINNGAAGYILVPIEGVGKYDDIHDFFKNVFDSLVIQKENARIRLENGTRNTSMFTRLIDGMKGEGYNIVINTGADKRNHTVTDIIDYSNGQNSKTIKFLEEKFNVTAKVSTEIIEDYDIKIIVASDYK